MEHIIKEIERTKDLSVVYDMKKSLTEITGHLNPYSRISYEFEDMVGIDLCLSDCYKK